MTLIEHGSTGREVLDTMLASGTSATRVGRSSRRRAACGGRHLQACCFQLLAQCIDRSRVRLIAQRADGDIADSLQPAGQDMGGDQQ